MKLSTPIVLAALSALVVPSHAYTCGGGYNACGPRGAFRARMMQPVSPQQQAEFRRQQAEFADRAFEAMARELQNSQLDSNFIPKQKELVNKVVELFTDMGTIRRDDGDSLRDFTNKGFELAQDLATGAYTPAYAVQDNKDTGELEISLDLPGVSKADIQILFEDGCLKVSGTRNMGTSRGVDVEEPKSVPFSRSFPMDAQMLDIENISATLDMGVLRVRIPKTQIENPPGKRIDIQ